MNIREGALTAPPKQENIIRDFLTRFHNSFEQVVRERERMDWYFFKRFVQRFEQENLSVKRGVKLTVKFLYKSSVRGNIGGLPDSGALDTVVLGKHYQIEMNMFYYFTGLEDSNFITGIKWNGFYTTFIHEYKHFLQSLRTIKAQTNDKMKDNTTTPYYDRPHEQQAWAEGYLERLKHDLQTDDLNVILNYLKKNELNGLPELQQLKTTNLSAWKAIMKQVVLAAQRDLR